MPRPRLLSRSKCSGNVYSAVGDLNRITRIVKLVGQEYTGVYGATLVANGASELLREALASAARMRGARLAWRTFRLVAAF